MLEELTPEQESLMITHRDRLLDFIMNNHKYPESELKLEDIQDDVGWIYEKAGLDKPKFIFFADSYLQEKLMINFIIRGGLELCLKFFQLSSFQVHDIIYHEIRNQIYKQIDEKVTNQIQNQVNEQVSGQVKEQVRDKAWNQLRNQVREQIWKQISVRIWNQVWAQLANQVLDQVYGQVSNQVFNQVNDQIDEQVTKINSQVNEQASKQVYSQIRDQVYSQVYDQIRNQLSIRQVDGQVINQVDNQVSSQLSNQVDNQVWAQLANQVLDQVYGQVEDQIRTQISNQVLSQVLGQLRNKILHQVYIQVDTQVSIQVASQIYNQVLEQVENNLTEEFIKKFNGYIKLEFIEQYFGLGYGSWISFYTYFRKIGILKNDDFNRFSDFINKGVWSMQFFKHWCIITRMPQKINRDAQNRLHSIDGSAVEWIDKKSKNYFIHGVSFTEELWEKVVTQKITVAEILKIENMEQRNAILSIISPSKLIKELNAKLISTHTQKKKGKEYMDTVSFSKLTHSEIKLYKINGSVLGLDDEDIYILFYTDPSTTREYFSFINPENTKDAATAMASKYSLTKKQFLNIIAES